MLAARLRTRPPLDLRAGRGLPLLGILVTAAALAFVAAMGIAARVAPAAPCATVPDTGLFLNADTGRSNAFSSQQMHALGCLMMPALVPTRGGVPGLAGASPHLSVTADGMMYNITWAGPHGRTASLMIDHHIASQLDVAEAEQSIDLGHGVRGFWTNWSSGRGNAQTHELGWRDPRTLMWYKINGLPLRRAIAFYHTLTPVKLVARQ